MRPLNSTTPAASLAKSKIAHEGWRYGCRVRLGLSFVHDSLVVLARDREGYAKLSRLISRGRLRVEKGEFQLTAEEVRAVGGEGLIILAGGPRSRLLALVQAGETKRARRELAVLREAFGDAFYLELTRHREPGDRRRTLQMLSLGAALNVPAVATNDIHFHVCGRKKLKRASLQPFVPNAKSVAIPKQDLDPIAIAIHEQE